LCRGIEINGDRPGHLRVHIENGAGLEALDRIADLRQIEVTKEDLAAHLVNKLLESVSHLLCCLRILELNSAVRAGVWVSIIVEVVAGLELSGFLEVLVGLSISLCHYVVYLSVDKVHICERRAPQRALCDHNLIIVLDTKISCIDICVLSTIEGGFVDSPIRLMYSLLDRLQVTAHFLM
jgi:hypothetical protein